MALRNWCRRVRQPRCDFTFFSIEQSAKLHPCCSARLHSSASIHSDLPEFGTPVTMVSSPGTTCNMRLVKICTGLPASSYLAVMLQRKHKILLCSSHRETANQ